MRTWQNSQSAVHGESCGEMRSAPASAATAATARSLPPEFFCPITMEVMVHPASTIDGARLPRRDLTKIICGSERSAAVWLFALTILPTKGTIPPRHYGVAENPLSPLAHRRTHESDN
eukprot:6175915-Pleurochrysis_carterae.AAC.1